MAYEILIPLEEENQYLALETRYQLGGQNWGTGQSEKRGIYLNFTKQTITHNDGYVSTKTALYAPGNYKIFIKELSRRSEKKIKEFHDYVEQSKDVLFKAWKNDDTETIFRVIRYYEWN